MAGRGEQEELAKAQFLSLKPPCVSLMREKTLKTVLSLEDVLKSLSPLSPSLLEYVLFPLQMTLQQSIGSDTHLAEAVLKCITFLFKSSRITSDKPFFELLSIFLVMIDKDEKSPAEPRLSQYKGAAFTSEEILERLLETLQHLFIRSDPSVLESFYSNVLIVGKSVSLIVETLKDSKSMSRQCLLRGVHCLVGVTHADSEGWMESIVSDFPKFCSDTLGVGKGEKILSSFLPGICLTLSELITSDNLLTLQLGLLALTHFIVLILNESQWENRELGNDEKNVRDKGQLLVRQDEDWWKMADNKMQKLLSSLLLSLSRHDSWKVRLALTASATKLLTSCQKSLPGCCGPVIELLVTLSLDTQPAVANNANTTMDFLSASMKYPGTLTSIMEEKLYDLSSTLPRLMRDSSEEKKLISLKLLQGYLKFLKSQVSHVTCSSAHMTRLLQALAQSIQLDTSRPLLMESKKVGVVINQDDEYDWAPPLSFSHLRDSETIKSIQESCRLLGRHGNTSVVMDTLVHTITGSESNRSEYLLILHWLMKGVGPHASLNLLINGLIDVWEEIRGDGLSLNISSTLVYQICFINLLIGDVAVIQGVDFVVHLQHTLGIVMANISSSNAVVSRTSVGVASQIAVSTGHNDLQSLITGCADYLVNEVHHQLLYYPSKTISCHILRAIIEHCDYELLSLLKDCKDTLILSLHQSPLDGWSVLHSLSKRLPDWVAMETKEVGEKKQMEKEVQVEDEDDSRDERVTLEDISNYFMNYHNKKREEEEEEKEIEENEEEEGDIKTDSKAPTPPAIQASIDTLQSSVHYVSIPNLPLQLCILDCISLCLSALRHRESELLPQVHTVWSPLAHRLIDTHIPVRIKAIDVLLVMASAAKEFLRKRVVEHVWPKLVVSLKQLRGVACDATPTISHTMEYKLLVKILESVGNLCKELNVSVDQIEDIAQEVILFLSSENSDPIQKLGLETCRTLSDFAPDLMWLLCIQLSPSLLPPIPSLSSVPSNHRLSLKEIKLPRSKVSHLYLDNILKLGII
ncbi:PREDICTED: TELO2-interacting protein 1 homolog [Amphimedon queenslandica]|uniref:TELO2-interacting protein 1 homolog n=1 Tax=Amphimedon queenslandica TaxID=400682 RepID=A0AAN0JCD7_AMPQE|nr:PREDICTED: TELO2-interacting protein 1 homolog [Amphimedon queenslandica]|eukprot:XP_019854680.1 PREDICTED: TELO2-interacting protein 1 homolog [Amphimedon queenslandica]